MSRRKQAKPRPVREDEEDEVPTTVSVVAAAVDTDESTSVNTADVQEMKSDTTEQNEAENDNVETPVKDTNNNRGNERESLDDSDRLVIVEPTDPDDVPSSTTSSISGDQPSPSSSIPSTPGKGRKNNSKIVPVAVKSGEKKYICPICNQQLESQHELTVHIRNHNSKVPSSHSCTICGKVLCSQSSLDRHMLVHSGERPFKCQICHVSFTTNGNMHRHMRVHEKEFAKSPYLLKSALDSGLLNWNSENRRGRKRKQSLFNSTAGGADEKRRAIEKDDNTPLAFPLKMESDEQQESMKLPVSSPKNDSDDSQECKVMCRSCGSQFDNSSGLEQHLENNPECHFKCGECGNQFIDLRTLNMHKALVHSQKDSTLSPLAKQNGLRPEGVGFHEVGFVDFSTEKFPLIAKSWCEKNIQKSGSEFHSFDCKKCGMAFPSNDALKIHMISHVPNNVIHCDFCDCDFVDNASLKEHLLTHTAEMVLSDDESKNVKDSEVAKGDFFAMLNLASGSESSEGESKIRSDMQINQDYFHKLGQIDRPGTGMSSATSSAIPSPVSMIPEDGNSQDFADIQKIIQNTSGIPSFSMARGSPLSAGLQSRFMMSAFPFKQDFGDMDESDRSLAASPTESSLTDVAMETAAENEEKGKPRFTCKYCELGFDTFNAMKVHMRSHLGLSPFKCNMCPYASADKTTLIRHLRTHNGERPFQCKICNFAFTTKANCERHVKKKHGRDTKDAIDEAVGYNQSMKEASAAAAASIEGPVTPVRSTDTVCKYCGEDFKFFRALKHHLRSHTSCRLKPYQCTLCDIGFSTRANCIRHIQKQHGQVNVSSVDKFIRQNSPSNMSSVLQQAEPPKLAASYPNAVMALQAGIRPQIFVTPPPAHSSRPQVPQFPMQVYPPTFHAGTPNQLQTPVVGKVSTPPPMATGGTPIDFSVKSEPEDFTAKKESPDAPVGASEQRHDTPIINLEEPMDLSRPLSASSDTPKSSYSEDKPGKLQQMLFAPLSQPSINLASTPAVPPSFRTFRCPVCQVQFSSESKLHIHMKTHTTNRPYQCTFCPAGFTIKTNLDIHVRTRHLDSQPAAPSTLASLHSMLGSRKFVSPTLRMMAKRKQSQPQHRRAAEATITKEETDAEMKLDEQQMTADDVAVVGRILRSSPKKEAIPQIPITDGNMAGLTSEYDLPIEPSLEQLRMIMETSSQEGMKNNDLDSPGKKKKNSYANAPNRVACPYCGRNFPWISSLRRHILTHTGQKPFKCPECSVWFSTKSNRERHLLRKHGLNPNNPNSRQIMDRPYKCQLCVFSSFSKPEKLLMHYKSKHPEADPPANLQNIASLEKWDHTQDDSSHEKDGDSDDAVDESPIKAEPEAANTPDPAIDDAQDDNASIQSSETGETIVELSNNDETIIDESNPGTPVPVDQKIMEDDREPSPRPIPRYLINPERDNYNVDKILDCWVCNGHFATRKLLLRHLKEHNVDFPYKCYLCDASFISRKECLEHKTIVHEQDWEMLKERNKIDELYSFISVMDKLAEEQKQDEPEIPKPEPVEGEESNTAPVERKVFCSLCTKRFWSLQDLRRHMRSHTGEKPFECDICGRYFTLKHSMMRHRRKHNIADDEAPPVRSYRQRNIVVEQALQAVQNGSARNTPDHEMFNNMGPGPGPKENFPLLSRAMIPNTVPAVSMPMPIPMKPSAMSSVAGLFGDSDILHNLLGVESASIDRMLDSADNAAQMLGM